MLFPKKFDPYGLDVSNFCAFYKTQYNQASHEINECNRQTKITHFFGTKSVSPPSIGKFNAFAKREREEKLKLVKEEKNEPEFKRSPK